MQNSGCRQMYVLFILASSTMQNSGCRQGKLWQIPVVSGRGQQRVANDFHLLFLWCSCLLLYCAQRSKARVSTLMDVLPSWGEGSRFVLWKNFERACPTGFLWMYNLEYTCDPKHLLNVLLHLLYKYIKVQFSFNKSEKTDTFPKKLPTLSSSTSSQGR